MKKRTAVTILLNIFFILLVFVIILPAAWLIMNSLKTNVELFTDSLALPAKVQFANYISAWNKGLYKYFGNSVIVSSISLISILFLSSLLAYGITRFNSRFGNLIFLITLGGMALSEQVALVPLYKILQATHLYNNILGGYPALCGIQDTVYRIPDACLFYVYTKGTGGSGSY